ncbi:unnamed protein product, partial [Ectocarpus sp. 8 AP-2014]
DGLAREGLDEDLHAATEAEHQVKSRLLLDVVVRQGAAVLHRLLLDVVVRQGAAVLQLLAGEDQTLLVRGDTLLVLDLLLHAVDRVRRLDVKSDGLAREGLDEDLHAATEAEHQVQGRLLQ